MVLEGATIYDGHQEGFVKTKLKGRKVRGIMNRHMLCSEKELGTLGRARRDHPAGVRRRAGHPIAGRAGGRGPAPGPDPEPGALPIHRRRRARSGGVDRAALRPPSVAVVMEGAPAAEAIGIEIEDPALCPRFTATLIWDIQRGPSPYWMQYRLKLVGMRPINNVVDITNYVMMELGQPLHAFDYDLLNNRAQARNEAKPTIIVRPARPGESMTSLDGVERRFNDYDILITDTAGPIGIGGVMGGLETEVVDDTRNVLLEAANFNYINIRRTAQAHKLPSEASARFGKGIHPADAIRGARRAAELMRVLAGGAVGKGTVDNYPAPPQPVVATVTPAQVTRALGVELDQEQIVAILEALFFKCEVRDGVVYATAPDHRLDIGTGLVGTADLIEEIARIYGYDRIPETEMGDRLPPLRANPKLEREERTRDLLAAAGLQEIISYRLTTPEAEARILAQGARPDDRPYTTLANPISQDKVTLRHTLLESMFSTVSANLRHHPRVALFEIGQVYLASEEGDLPDEPTRLCIGMAGQRETASWMGGDERLMDFFDLKGVLQTLTQGWRIDNVHYEPTQHPSFQPGRAARHQRRRRRRHCLPGGVRPGASIGGATVRNAGRRALDGGRVGSRRLAPGHTVRVYRGTCAAVPGRVSRCRAGARTKRYPLIE